MASHLRWLCAGLPAAVAAAAAVVEPGAAPAPGPQVAAEPLAGALGEEEEEEVKAPKPAGYDWPAFANWDCVDVQGTLDWDEAYSNVVRNLRGEDGELSFTLPDNVIPVLTQQGREAYLECPLGTLYFMVLYTYEMLAHYSEKGLSGKDRSTVVAQADNLQKTIRRFPFFVIGAARWPTWEALAHFSRVHRPQNDKAEVTLCHDVRGSSGIDWQVLQDSAMRWSDDQLRGLEPGEGDQNHTWAIKAAADAVYKNPKSAGVAAQEECPFGFLFLCSTQALAAAVHITGSFEAWARALDSMLAELPFFSIGGSKWPTFKMLAMLSSLSRGEDSKALGGFQQDVHRWGGIHPQSKRFRRYGDLRLAASELAPFGRTSEGWSEVDKLVELSAEEWYVALAPSRLRKLRPVMLGALDAALAVVRSATLPGRRECGFSGITSEGCKARGCTWQEPAAAEAGAQPSCLRAAPKRKVVAVTFVWGERWAPLVPRFAAWATKLGMGAVVVAMGDTSRKTCEAATRALGSSTASGIACWDPLHYTRKAESESAPERGSILQRHAMMHLLLHLGVDVLAFDFDTFFFSDPRPHLEELAEREGADVLMTRHLDADCLNMGLIYVRASTRTAEWYSRYLQWLHQHPFEREQRGANALLNFTKQAVSFQPKNMPPVKAVALDDANEYASSRGGWQGDWSRLRFFHWVNPERTLSNWPDIKVVDLQGLYEAALHHSTDLMAGGGSFARLLGESEKGSYLYAVREVLETMRIEELPRRRACW